MAVPGRLRHLIVRRGHPNLGVADAAPEREPDLAQLAGGGGSGTGRARPPSMTNPISISTAAAAMMATTTRTMNTDRAYAAALGPPTASRDADYRRSMMVALAMPPPSHIVCRP